MKPNRHRFQVIFGFLFFLWMYSCAIPWVGEFIL